VPEQAAYSIAVVCEADADRRTACTLSDRVLREAVAWIAPECWILAGFEPRDDAERALLDRERRNLGFDPRSSGEQLTASESGARRDAKRVLAALTGGDRDREDACLEEPALAVLEQRGATTGLASYLREVEERLVPLFDPSARR
jgi:hypothetical protein